MIAAPTIFWSFLGAGLVSFGGAMPHVQRMVVERKKWMDSAEFAETVGLCQFIPGPNATNVSICVGQKVGGLPGALAAALGLLFFPIGFALIVASVFSAYADAEWVRQFAHGMALSGAGLLLAAGIKLTQGIKSDKVKSYGAIGLVLLLSGVLKVSLLAVIVGLLSVALLGSYIKIRKSKNASF